MADFTPGPWEAGPNPQGLYSNDWVVRPAGEFPHGEWIADVGAGTTDATRRANARLIAAAPEMYMELHEAHHLYKSLRDMVLNERGPLAEMNLGNDAINAILGLIDDHAPKIDSLAKAEAH
jgi:hypothetical protein